MQYRPPNAHQEVSNTNHFGFVSDSLGQLAAASECIASSSNNKYTLPFALRIHPSKIQYKLNTTVYTHHKRTLNVGTY